MAEQTITLDQSWFFSGAIAVSWQPLGINRPQIDADLASARPWFAAILFKKDGSIELRFANPQSETAADANDDLSATFEASGSFVITAETAELSVSMAGADTAEPYVFTPSNSAEVTAFYNAVRALPGGMTNEGVAGSLILRDFVPVAPEFEDDTGTAITAQVGDTIADVTVPEATGSPTPTYAVEGTLPAGMTFNQDSPPDDAAGVLSFDETAIVPGSGTITIRATNSEGSDDWTVDYTFEEAAISADLGSHALGALTVNAEATAVRTDVSAVLGSHALGALTADLSATVDTHNLDLNLFQATGTVHMAVCIEAGVYQRGNGQENLWASDAWTEDGAAGQVGTIRAGSWDITGIAGNAPVIRRLARWDDGDRLIFNTTGTGALNELFDASDDPYRVSLVRLVSGVPSVITIEPPSTGGNTGFVDWREDDGDMTADEWAFINAIAAGDDVIIAIHQGTASYEQGVSAELGSHALGALTASAQATPSESPVTANLGSHALGTLTVDANATPSEDPVSADPGSHALGALTGSTELIRVSSIPAMADLGSNAFGALTVNAEVAVQDQTSASADLGSHALGALTVNAEVTPHESPIPADLGSHALGALTASAEAAGSDDPALADLGSHAFGALTVALEAMVTDADPISAELGTHALGALSADMQARVRLFAESWPSDLPQYFLQNGFRMAPMENRRGFQPDDGPEIRQRRFTRSDMLIQGVVRCSPAQWEDLKEFYQETLHGGRLPFDFPKPLRSITTDIVEVRFVRPPSRRKNGANWDVSLSLREID